MIETIDPRMEGLDEGNTASLCIIRSYIENRRVNEKYCDDPYRIEMCQEEWIVNNRTK